VQGCPFHCQGCIAPDWIPFTPSTLYDPTNLADRILTDPQIIGLTFSGGEPMFQAIGLAVLAKEVKRQREINIICFTGYRYETLNKMPGRTGIPELLTQIDVLIDGPYLQTQNTGRGLRGSDNQRFIHLTDRLRDYDFEHMYRTIEVQILHNEILMVGIPPKNIHPQAFLDGLVDTALPKEVGR
jgi:anaerobic ribonucleoside-triphosphate reductase activating protein